MKVMISNLSNVGDANDETFCTYHNEGKSIYCFDCRSSFCNTCFCLFHSNVLDSHLYFPSASNVKETKYLINANQRNIDFLFHLKFVFPNLLDEKITEMMKKKEEQKTYLEQLIKAITHRYDSIIAELSQIKDKIKEQVEQINYQQEEIKKLLQLRYKTKNTGNNKNILTPPNMNNTFGLNDNAYKDEFNSLCTKNENIIFKYENMNNIINSTIIPMSVNLVTNRFTYKIENFLDLYERHDQITSPIFKVNFLSWCIILTKEVDNQINIYLQLVDGAENMQIVTNYKFDIVHPVSKKKNFNYYSCSIYAKGKKWGKEEFCKVNYLIKEGFIDKEGAIAIQCAIKPNSKDDFQKELDYYYETHKVYL